MTHLRSVLLHIKKSRVSKFNQDGIEKSAPKKKSSPHFGSYENQDYPKARQNLHYNQ